MREKHLYRHMFHGGIIEVLMVSLIIAMFILPANELGKIITEKQKPLPIQPSDQEVKSPQF